LAKLDGHVYLLGQGSNVQAVELGILQLEVATPEIIRHRGGCALVLEGLAGGRTLRKSIHFVHPRVGFGWCVNHIDRVHVVELVVLGGLPVGKEASVVTLYHDHTANLGLDANLEIRN